MPLGLGFLHTDTTLLVLWFSDLYLLQHYNVADNNEVILNLSQCKAKWNLAHGAYVFHFIFRRQMLYCQKEY